MSSQEIKPQSPAHRPPSKYKFGKVKSIPTIQEDKQTGLTYIRLTSRSDEKLYGCTHFNARYRDEEKLGQGTFGSVYKGVHLETQRQVAMKRIIISEDRDLFPITAQREITILKKLDHKNVVKLIEMVYDYPPSSQEPDQNQQSKRWSGTNSVNGNNDKLSTKAFYMILPYMVADLSGVLHNPRIKLELSHVKNIMLQLLEAVNYVHCQKFMHRDIKTANLLLDHRGVLKLADFGLARTYYGAPPNLKFPGGAGSGASYTSVVVTRWYRAPELVLGDKRYTTAVDIWGVGCVLGELFEKKPILPGTTDVDQGHTIFKLLGTPTKDIWKLAYHLPGAELTKTNYKASIDERFGRFLSESGLDLMKKLLALDPYKRITSMAALKHPFFIEDPLPSTQLDCICEESHESDIKRYKEELHQSMSQRAPPAPSGKRKGVPDSPTSFANVSYDMRNVQNKRPNTQSNNMHSKGNFNHHSHEKRNLPTGPMGVNRSNLPKAPSSSSNAIPKSYGHNGGSLQNRSQSYRPQKPVYPSNPPSSGSRYNPHSSLKKPPSQNVGPGETITRHQNFKNQTNSSARPNQYYSRYQSNGSNEISVNSSKEVPNSVTHLRDNYSKDHEAHKLTDQTRSSVLQGNKEKRNLKSDGPKPSKDLADLY